MLEEIGPLQPVTFAVGSGLFRPQWQVCLNEDGTLSIMPVGRRPGRIHVVPGSHTSIVVTTDKITRGEGGPS